MVLCLLIIKLTLDRTLGNKKDVNVISQANIQSIALNVSIYLCSQHCRRPDEYNEDAATNSAPLSKQDDFKQADQPLRSSAFH